MDRYELSSMGGKPLLEADFFPVKTEAALWGDAHRFGGSLTQREPMHCAMQRDIGLKACGKKNWGISQVFLHVVPRWGRAGQPHRAGIMES